MKTIGLLGGMSWESTVPYYRVINQEIGRALGGHHSARLILYSVDFHEIEALQQSGEWERAGELLGRAARVLEAAGADFLLLCTNTMHTVFDQVQESVQVPLLHITDALAEAIGESSLSKLGLLGTRFTMEGAFYRERLERQHGLEILIPSSEDRERVHRVIYEELCKGVVLDSSRTAFRAIIERLRSQGAEGIILGCTEISLLVSAEDSSAPLFDTASLHALKAVAWALADADGRGPPRAIIAGIGAAGGSKR